MVGERRSEASRVRDLMALNQAMVAISTVAVTFTALASGVSLRAGPRRSGRLAARSRSACRGKRSFALLVSSAQPSQSGGTATAARPGARFRLSEEALVEERLECVEVGHRRPARLP
jgi:hypothetical protein